MDTMTAHYFQPPLPAEYRGQSDEVLRGRIAAAKSALGKRLLILGHHYQQTAVVDFADFAGDSFELSRKAAAQTGIDYVIFCGVHFMAESADILTEPRVRVILPDLGAGCSMADMASLEQAEDCWEQLRAAAAGRKIVPITYVNSSAAIKAFVGKNGGAVCTSSNCQAILRWALERGNHPQVLFLPDQHLGRNTAYQMGHPLDSMVVWDPQAELGGHTAQRLERADFVLWKGHCSVHQLFRPEHVDQARRQDSQVKVIVHPECAWEVVQKADLSGSTSFIVKQIEAAAPGTHWAVGTEVHLVQRLAQRHPEQKIKVLSDCQCLCTTMFRIDLAHLCWTVENLAAGKVVNQIKVEEPIRGDALKALERMLSIVG